MNRSPIAGFLMGLTMFVLALLVSRAVFYFISTNIVWLEQVLTKAVLIVLSIAAIKFFLSMSLKNAGFRKSSPKMRKRHVILSGVGLGALTSILIFFTPAEGVPLAKKLNLSEFLLVVVIWSSVSEEVFLRGFLQTYLNPLENKKVNILSYSLSVPVFTCALVFSAMHLSLLFAGTDYYTVCFTLFATFLLGLLAGVYREKYGSLIPSVLTHMSFNVGGILAGIIITILYRVTTGEFPIQ